MQFVCEFMKFQEWLLEDLDEQVTDQPFPSCVRWSICVANLKARKAVIPVVPRRSLAESPPRLAGYCPSEVRNMEFTA